MIVAVLVTATGLFVVGSVTQLYGYRLGGTIVVPVLAVYTLKNAVMLPIFLLSTMLAFVGLSVVKQTTLIYGRDELLVVMGIGSVIPLSVLIALSTQVPDALRSVVFVGSILPGLAAFNYHQVKPQYRLADVVTATFLYVGLVALGWILVTPTLAGTLGTITPPALYTETSDVAVFKRAAVSAYLDPAILPRSGTVGLFLAGLVASELIRGRYGIRIGLVAVPLLAIYSLASAWLIVLYVVLLGTAFAFIQLVHIRTLLYGRVLISLTTGVTLLVAVPAVVALPIGRGLSAYFVAILAGVNAYNWHTASRPKRPLFVVLQFGLFALMLLVARALGEARLRGFPQEFGVAQIVGGLLVAVICLGVAEYVTVPKPDREEVFSASILSGENK